MFRRRGALALALLFCSVALAGCSPDGVPTSPPQDTGPLLRTASGRLVPARVVKETQEDLARSVAISLQNPQLRQLVFSALSQSRFKEHKLHFRSLLAGDGSDLLNAMASARGRSAAAILSALDDAYDLALYMPVPDHRATWTGGGNLIVVTALNESSQPVGYDLTGAPVEGLTLLRPPSTPTLVLVRGETDFAPSVPLAGPAVCDPEDPECEGGGGGGGGGGSDPCSANTPSYCLTEWNFEDTGWDPWPFGAPEFEVTVAYFCDNLDYCPSFHGSLGYARPESPWLAGFQCVSEGFSEFSIKYWNYDDPGYAGSGTKPIQVAGNNGTNPSLVTLSGLLKFIIVSEDDDNGCAGGHFPSYLGEGIFNDDDLVGVAGPYTSADVPAVDQSISPYVTHIKTVWVN